MFKVPRSKPRNIPLLAEAEQEIDAKVRNYSYALYSNPLHRNINAEALNNSVDNYRFNLYTQAYKRQLEGRELEYKENAPRIGFMR